MTKQQLIEDNMNLVYALVSREYPTYIHDEDIIQTGMLGLCQAAEKWDESRAKFSDFAWYCIRHEICKEFRRRAKHQGVLSLDYETTNADGERTTFGDFIVGDEDVCYIDDCSNKLTPLQQRIVDALKAGLTPKEVATTLNTTLQSVYSTQRKIRLLRGKVNE
jgi:RNA polymerase sigma factor (sigma-70 family)